MFVLGVLVASRSSKNRLGARKKRSLAGILIILALVVVLFGGTYDKSAAGAASGLAFGGSHTSMLLGFIAYCLVGAAMTAFFSLRIFDHPTSDLMKLGAKIAGLGKKGKEQA